MDNTSSHLAYVIVAYALSGFVLTGLLLWTVWRSRSLTKQLADRNLADPGGPSKP